MNKITILDAAMGSELEQRGVPMHKEIWAGLAALEHSDVIQSIHEDNINIGADVITTNTFSTARHCLVPIGYADKTELINKKSVEVALRARDKCKKKDDLRKPFFILYCDKCKIFFKDEKKYNKHLSKYHGEN